MGDKIRLEANSLRVNPIARAFLSSKTFYFQHPLPHSRSSSRSRCAWKNGWTRKLSGDWRNEMGIPVGFSGLFSTPREYAHGAWLVRKEEKSHTPFLYSHLNVKTHHSSLSGKSVLASSFHLNISRHKIKFLFPSLDDCFDNGWIIIYITLFSGHGKECQEVPKHQKTTPFVYIPFMILLQKAYITAAISHSFPLLSIPISDFSALPLVMWTVMILLHYYHCNWSQSNFPFIIFKAEVLSASDGEYQHDRNSSFHLES